MARAFLRKCLVVGSAINLWDDVAKARELGEFDATYCVKLTGVHWPARFQVWCSLHPEWMDKYEAERHALNLPNGYEIVLPLESEVGTEGKRYGKRGRRLTYRWPGMNASGSSGLFAVKAALNDGFDRVVIAGMPMDNSNHFTRGKAWKQRDSFTAGWEQAMPHLVGKVKSLSGWTAEKLGAPDARWINGG